MSNEQKSELAACLHCNGAAMEDFTFVGRREETKHYIFCQGCGAQTGLYKTKAEAITAWNRRYVCPDKHGKAVYAGDGVMVAGETGRIVFCSERLAWCVGLTTNETLVSEILDFDGIELIQETK